MAKHQSRSITFRCPGDLLKKLEDAAAGESPANTMSREIVERLTRSFEADNRAHELANLAAQNVVDMRAEIDALKAEMRALKKGRK
jgi:hypothetical protein